MRLNLYRFRQINRDESNMLLRRTITHSIEQVERHLWRLCFHLPVPTNCYLVKDEEGLSLIDAGHPWNASTILDTAELIGAPLRRIFITHAHPDHAGAAAQLSRKTGARIFAHEDEAPFLLGKSSIAEAPSSFASACLHQAGRVLGILDPPSVDEVTFVGDGESVSRVAVIHTPGHTPGSISLYLKDEGALLVGDNVSHHWSSLRLNFSWYTLDEGNLKESFYRYRDFFATTLLTGHGPPYRSEDVVSDMLAMVESCRLPRQLRQH